MENGPSPQPVPNTVISSTALQAYFKSIEDLFRETRTGLAAADKSPLGNFVLIFVFSLIPLIPYLLSKLAFVLWGPLVTGFRSFHFHVASFWFWWIVSFIASLSMLILVAKFSGPGPEEKRRWLSPQQMRFAYCYEAADEIRKYRTNHLDRHIETALQDLSEVATALMQASTLNLAEGIHPYHYWQLEAQARENQAHRSVGERVERPKWFRLEPDTELIVRAFPRFLPRLRDRLKDRKDLVTIESVLTDLAGYLYTEIPELSDSESQSAFERAGVESLLSFARRINDLPPYRSEPLPQTPKEKASEKILSLGRKLSAPFNHENALVSFWAWYVLLLVLFCTGFYIAFRYVPTLKIDSTVVATIVGGPIATAATAVAIPRLTKGKKQDG